MLSTNLVTLLKTFSKEEFREFGKFIKSPFFNNRKDIISYYSFLKKHHPGFTGKCFTAENIFSHVYAGRPFNNNEFLKLNSAMNQLGNDFLRFSSDRFFNDYRLLGQYVDRNLGKQFRTLYKKLDDYLENEAELDNLIFIKKIYLETFYIKYSMNRDRQKEICPDIIKRGNYFAYQSLMWIMIQSRDMAANYSAFNYDYKESPANKFIESIDLEKLVSMIEYENNRLGRFLKYYVYCMMITMHPEKGEYFFVFKESFRAIYDEVNRMEKNNYLARMQTYVMKHIQKGDLKYLNELLDAYKFFFDKKGIFENDFIPMPPFRNCITLSLEANDFDFAKKLIDKYSERLYPEYRQDTKNICRALVEFKLKNYDAVIDSLKIFSYSYPLHKIDVRHLLLKTYFEMNEFDHLQSHIDSFRHFLSNNKTISAGTKNKYHSLLNLVSQIYTAKINSKTKHLAEIKKNISNYDLFIFDKFWLSEKIFIIS
jgi:hypothetical protein